MSEVADIMAGAWKAPPMALVERGGEGLEALKQDGMLSYLEVRATLKEMKAVRDKLMKIVKSLSRRGAKAGRGSSSFRLTIAFFPLMDRRRST